MLNDAGDFCEETLKKINILGWNRAKCLQLIAAVLHRFSENEADTVSWVFSPISAL